MLGKKVKYKGFRSYNILSGHIMAMLYHALKYSTILTIQF